jgi:hypothetical protein
MDVWVEEVGYNPKYDAAVRAWAMSSKKVARVVRAVDKERIEALRQLFVECGQGEAEAQVRANICYFHQVGYYAVGMKERRAKRREYVSFYYKIIGGFA